MQADAPIQMLWIGNQLSPIEQLCMKSFLYHGHQVDLFAYSDINVFHQMLLYVMLVKL